MSSLSFFGPEDTMP